MTNYKQTYQHLVTSLRGSYEDLEYMPVFRASAIFPAFHNLSFTTKLSCFNYWKHKNNCEDVGILVTLRDALGTKIGRVFHQLQLDTYDFHVSSLLENESDFSGSVEIEIFSNQDLKFQFPAVSCFYCSPLGVSYVHSAQRVYNHLDDEKRGAALNNRQTAFDVLPDLGASFVHVLNGPHAVVDSELNVEELDAHGRKIDCAPIPINLLPPYGLQTIDLTKYAAKDNRLPGHTFKITAPLSGIHCRFVVGNAESNNDWYSVTHSYPDFSNSRDIILDSLEGDEVYAIAPITLLDGVDTDVVLYPVYGCETLTIELLMSVHGRQSAAILSTYKWNPQKGTQLRVPISQLYKDSTDAAPSSDHFVFLKMRSEGGTPSRVTYGLNYSIDGHAGTNISTSALVSKYWNTTPRTWKWGPIVPSERGKNFILVSCLKLPNALDVSFEFAFSIYRSTGIIYRSNFTMRNLSSMSICAEDLIAQHDSTEILWYTIMARESVFDINQIFISEHGRIGGDHSF